MLIIDRKEGDFFVVINENNESLNLHKDLFEDKIKEGDCIFFNNATCKYDVDIKATENRKRKIKNKFYKLIKNK